MVEIRRDDPLPAAAAAFLDTPVKDENGRLQMCIGTYGSPDYVATAPYPIRQALADILEGMDNLTQDLAAKGQASAYTSDTPFPTEVLGDVLETDEPLAKIVTALALISGGKNGALHAPYTKIIRDMPGALGEVRARLEQLQTNETLPQQITDFLRACLEVIDKTMTPAYRQHIAPALVEIDGNTPTDSLERL